MSITRCTNGFCWSSGSDMNSSTLSEPELSRSSFLNLLPSLLISSASTGQRQKEKKKNRGRRSGWETHSCFVNIQMMLLTNHEVGMDQDARCPDGVRWLPFMAALSSGGQEEEKGRAKSQSAGALSTCSDLLRRQIQNHIRYTQVDVHAKYKYLHEQSS